MGDHVYFEMNWKGNKGGVLVVEIEEMKYEKICCGVENHCEKNQVKAHNKWNVSFVDVEGVLTSQLHRIQSLIFLIKFKHCWKNRRNNNNVQASWRKWTARQHCLDRNNKIKRKQQQQKQ